MFYDGKIPKPKKDWPWETRRDGELTTVYLGRVLDDYVGCPKLARRAREGHFDDYFAPPEVASGFELIALVKELRNLGAVKRQTRDRAKEVIAAVKTGEFDGTSEESARWEASKDGQTALADPAAQAGARELLKWMQDPDKMAAALRAADKL